MSEVPEYTFLCPSYTGRCPQMCTESRAASTRAAAAVLRPPLRILRGAAASACPRVVRDLWGIVAPMRLQSRVDHPHDGTRDGAPRGPPHPPTPQRRRCRDPPQRHPTQNGAPTPLHSIHRCRRLCGGALLRERGYAVSRRSRDLIPGRGFQTSSLPHGRGVQKRNARSQSDSSPQAVWRGASMATLVNKSGLVTGFPALTRFRSCPVHLGPISMNGVCLPLRGGCCSAGLGGAAVLPRDVVLRC